MTLWTPDIPRRELEDRFLRARSDLVEVGGTLLHVRADGDPDDPAVIMIHGFGASLHTWEPWAMALADTHRVIRFDLPGSGLSQPDTTKDYTDRRSMELLLALMDRSGISKATLIGNSIGGRIAWKFAANHEDRVSALVLVAPDGFASPGFEYGKAPDVSWLLHAMRFVLPKWALKANLKPSYGDPARLTDDTVDRYYSLLRAPGNRAAMIDRLSQTVLVDPVPLLSDITVPVLLMWGEQDALIPVTNAEDYLDALPDAQLVTFPGLGHVPHEEAPKRTLTPVQTFLSR